MTVVKMERLSDIELSRKKIREDLFMELHMKWKSLKVCIALLFCLQASVAISRTSAEAYQEAIVEFQNAQWDKSIQSLNTAVQLDPKNWQAYEQLGHSYFKKKDYQSAYFACQASLKIHPDNPELEKFLDDQVVPFLPKTLAPGVSPTTETPSAATPVTSFQSPAIVTDKNSIYLHIGLAAPYAPNGFRDDWGNGFNFGAGAGFVISQTFSIILDVNYTSFPLIDTVGPGVDFTGGTLSTFTVLGNTKFKFISEDNPVVPYVILGMGPAWFNIQPITASNYYTGFSLGINSVQETDLAFRVGIGIDIRLNGGSSIFIESNGIDTFVSDQVSSTGFITNSALVTGLKFKE